MQGFFEHFGLNITPVHAGARKKPDLRCVVPIRNVYDNYESCFERDDFEQETWLNWWRELIHETRSRQCFFFDIETPSVETEQAALRFVGATQRWRPGFTWNRVGDSGRDRTLERWRAIADKIQFVDDWQKSVLRE